MDRSTPIVRQLGFAAILGVMSLGCGAGQSAPTARRVVISAPKGETNMVDPDGKPSTACRTACGAIQSPDERVASCEIAGGSVSLAELFPDPTFVVCKLERK